MRIELVTAVAFGPFRNETIDLAPGMTVIGGPNEAGKSTWHAALRAAVCGARRGRGRPSADDARFADLHQPWDQPDPWEVEARIVLKDGRRIEMRQDLGAKVASRARDIDLGRDVSADVMNEGAPDASVWLGMTREAFVRTACIDQGEILAVTSAAGSLQDQLQRAAATRGTDATAAEALERLRAYRAELIGSDRAPTRPLMMARARKREAEAALAAAKRDHDAYRVLVERAEAARRAHRAASEELRAVEHVITRARAEALVARRDRARELADRHHEAPASLPARDDLADVVAAALKSWADRPAPLALAGDSADQLRDAIARLPSLPDGDLRPAGEVETAYRSWRAAVDSTQLEAEEPTVPALPGSGGLSEADLRRLATDLGAPDPAADASIAASAEAAKRRVLALERPPVAVLIVAAGVAAGIAATLLAIGVSVAAGACAVASIALFAWAARRRAARASAAAELKTAEARLAPGRLAAEAARARRAEAESALSAAGLTATPEGVWRLADEVAAYSRAADDHARWTERANRLASAVEKSSDVLRGLLAERGINGPDDLDAAYTMYVGDCSDRLAQRTEALKADTLRQALAAREEAEAGAGAAEARRVAAEQELRITATRAGLDGTADPDRLVEQLESWRTARATVTAEAETGLREWEELQGLLAGGTVADLDRHADQELRRAANLGEGLTVAAIDAVRLDADPDAQLAAERSRLAALATEADQLEARAEAAARSAPSVAEADESLARATEEVDRLESANGVLGSAIALLEAAQHRVHRDLAPILAAAIRPQLAVVTGGRYVDVAVDPAELEVRVKESPALGSRWREASRMSRGTQEQVYLLLRAAMAEHLVTTDEVAPLILDEVTAQSDDARAAAVLSTLLELSRMRQVILFTHDDTVVDWARSSLGERDRLIELSPAGGTHRATAVASPGTEVAASG